MRSAKTLNLPQMKRMRGITLLELMIEVMIVGILAAIASPNSRALVARAKRTEAKALLLEIAANQERFYLNANRYGTVAELGYATPLITPSGSYTVTIPANDASGYTATAAYNFTGSEFDRCSSFTIDGRGAKTSAGTIGNCWTDQR